MPSPPKNNIANRTTNTAAIKQRRSRRTIRTIPHFRGCSRGNCSRGEHPRACCARRRARARHALRSYAIAFISRSTSSGGGRFCDRASRGSRRSTSSIADLFPGSSLSALSRIRAEGSCRGRRNAMSSPRGRGGRNFASSHPTSPGTAAASPTTTALTLFDVQTGLASTYERLFFPGCRAWGRSSSSKVTPQSSNESASLWLGLASLEPGRKVLSSPFVEGVSVLGPDRGDSRSSDWRRTMPPPSGVPIARRASIDTGGDWRSRAEDPATRMTALAAFQERTFSTGLLSGPMPGGNDPRCRTGSSASVWSSKSTFEFGPRNYP